MLSQGSGHPWKEMGLEPVGDPKVGGGLGSGRDTLAVGCLIPEATSFISVHQVLLAR